MLARIQSRLFAILLAAAAMASAFAIPAVAQDVTPPVITDNQTGDNAWRESNNGLYNIDFSDSQSNLAGFQVRACKTTGFCATPTADWATATENLNSNSYTVNWSIPQTFFDSLDAGKNYISVRAFDAPGNSSVATDSFYILKAGTFEVMSAADSGVETLREAMGFANDHAGADSISFGISNVTIALASQLPALSDASGGTSIDATGRNIALTGGGDTAAFPAFEITEGSNEIRGFTLLEFTSSAFALTDLYGAIQIDGANAQGNTVAGNYIGVDALGGQTRGNTVGVSIGNGASDNVIGGSSEADQNTIAANRMTGVFLFGSGTDGNRIVGNYIGLSPNGQTAIGNDLDEAGPNLAILDGPANNEIGGPANGEGNFFAGSNTSISIALLDGPGQPTGNIIQGNQFNLTADGASHLSGTPTAIQIVESPGNRVGGDADLGEGNAITCSGTDSVCVSIIGATSEGTLVQGNTVGLLGTGALSASYAGGVGAFDAPGSTIGGAGGLGNVICGARSSGTQASGDGLLIYGPGATQTVVLGNYLGVDRDGTAGLGNNRGVAMIEQSDLATVGGPGAGEGNVISGNTTAGIFIQSKVTGATIQGNIIGATPDGAAALPNGVGIYITTTPDTAAELANGIEIGGVLAGEENLIAGNSGNGITLDGPNTQGTAVYGNFIGVGTDGSTNLGNGGDGILISNGSSGNLIGGTGSGQPNAIAYNAGTGVYVKNGDSLQSIENRISRNSIFQNGLLAIDLEPLGATPNSISSPSGPNLGMDFPVLDSVVEYAPNLYRITGTAPALSVVEIYQADHTIAPIAYEDGSNQGEAYSWAASTTADGAGAFTVSSLTLSNGFVFTALAIDADGNTSEMAVNHNFDSDAPTITLGGVPSDWINATSEISVLCDDGEGSGCVDSSLLIYYTQDFVELCPTGLGYYSASWPVTATSTAFVCGTGLDEANNRGYTQVASYLKVDATPPTLQDPVATSDNVLGSLYTGSSLDIEAAYSDTGGSGINASSCQYSMDGGAVWSAAQGGGGKCYKNGAAAQGAVNVVFKVEDQAGSSVTSATLALTQDASAPIVAVSGAPSAWQNYNAEADVGCDDGGAACEADSERIIIYDEDPVSCPANIGYYIDSPPQTVTEESWACGAARDAGGNYGYTAQPTHFMIDKLPPVPGKAQTAQITVSGGFYTGASLSLTWSAADNGPSGVAETGCGYSLNNGTAWASGTLINSNCQVGGLAVSQDLDILTLLEDKAGNSASTGPVSLARDADAPAIAISGLPSAWQPDSAVLTASCDDGGGIGCKQGATKLYLSDSEISECPASIINYTTALYTEITLPQWACAAGQDKLGQTGYDGPYLAKVDAIPPIFAGLQVLEDDQTGGSLFAEWNAALDEASPVTYLVYWANSQSLLNYATPKATTQDTSIHISNQIVGVRIYVVVRAMDPAGNKDENEIVLSAVPGYPDTVAPHKPTGVTAVRKNGAISLTWTAPTDNEDGTALNDLQGYQVYRRKAGASSLKIISSGLVASTAYTDSTIDPLEDYYYAVSAMDLRNNESDVSTEAFAGVCDGGCVEGVVSRAAYSASDPEAASALNASGLKLYVLAGKDRGVVAVFDLSSDGAYKIPLEPCLFSGGCAGTSMPASSNPEIILAAVEPSGLDSSFYFDNDGMAAGPRTAVSQTAGTPTAYEEIVLAAGRYAGDANRDGKTDGDDFIELKNDYSGSCSGAASCPGDFNCDRAVDDDDLAILKKHFFYSAPGGPPLSGAGVECP